MKSFGLKYRLSHSEVQLPKVLVSRSKNVIGIQGGHDLARAAMYCFRALFNPDVVDIFVTNITKYAEIILQRNNNILNRDFQTEQNTVTFTRQTGQLMKLMCQVFRAP